METKFTKGEWGKSRYGDGNVIAKVNDQERLVANCMGYSTNTDKGEHVAENLANAKLIAAAPDLLKVCCLVLDEWHSKTSNMYKKEPIFVQLAREAIRKATE